MARGHSPRREIRERQTLAAMVRLYCRDLHRHSQGLCGDCQNLVEYAFERIEKCPWGREKPTCANCSIHCYHAEKREQVRERMRYAGPRMLTRHPILSIQHLLDKRRASDLESLHMHRERCQPQSGPS